MEVHRSDSIPTARGPKDWFTGTVWMDRIVEAPRPARVHAVRVSFEPGPSAGMVHLAIHEADEEGSTTVWLEHVSETEYGGTPAAD